MYHYIYQLPFYNKRFAFDEARKGRDEIDASRGLLTGATGTCTNTASAPVDRWKNLISILDGHRNHAAGNRLTLSDIREW